MREMSRRTDVGARWSPPGVRVILMVSSAATPEFSGGRIALQPHTLAEMTGAPPPPGWYPDPLGRPVLREWDGTAWTSETRPPPPPVSPSPTAGAAASTDAPPPDDEERPAIGAHPETPDRETTEGHGKKPKDTVFTLLVVSFIAITAVQLCSYGGDRHGGGKGDGVFSVPDDMAPGIYHVEAGGSCYFARLDSIDKSPHAIIVNENHSGPLTVEVKATDAGFETKRCGKWEKAGRTASQPATSFATGIFLVGRDIAPGVYETKGRDGCYWRVTTDAGLADIVDNDNTSGPAFIVAELGQAVTSDGCGTWEQSE